MLYHFLSMCDSAERNRKKKNREDGASEVRKEEESKRKNEAELIDIAAERNVESHESKSAVRC